MVLYPLDGDYSYLDESSQSNVIISRVVDPYSLYRIRNSISVFSFGSGSGS
jgi:hypothetical protein